MWVNNIHEKETFLIIKTSFVIYEIKAECGFEII